MRQAGGNMTEGEKLAMDEQRARVQIREFVIFAVTALIVIIVVLHFSR